MVCGAASQHKRSIRFDAGGSARISLQFDTSGKLHVRQRICLPKGHEPTIHADLSKAVNRYLIQQHQLRHETSIPKDPRDLRENGPRAFVSWTEVSMSRVQTCDRMRRGIRAS